jgi:hypothetical protein
MESKGSLSFSKLPPRWTPSWASIIQWNSFYPFYLISVITFGNEDGSVSIVIRLRAERPGLISRQRFDLFTTASRQALGSTQPPIHWVPGVLFPEAKLPGREADHSRPSSAEVKNAWSYTSTPHTSSWSGAYLSTVYSFMAWYLVKHRDKFNLLYLNRCNIIVTRTPSSPKRTLHLRLTPWSRALI